MSKLNVDAVEPSSATTLTLGASGDTIDVPSGATLDVTGATVSGLSAGKVLQVVNATKSDTASTNSGTAVATGLSASITPSSTSNKVLVMVSFSYSSGADVNASFQLYRDSTAIHLADAASNRVRTSVGTLYQAASAANMHNGSINSLDTPSSTSSITYALYYFRGYGGSSNYVYFNRSSGDSDNNAYKRAISSITLMEIEA